MLEIARRASLLVILMGFATQHALAATTSFDVLVDTDANSATGCSFATPSGTLTGFELRVTVPVNTAATSGTVGALTARTCSGGVFGSATQFDAGGWPVGVGLGTGGSAVIEAFVPRSLLGSSPNVRLVLVSSSEVIGPVIVPLGGGPAPPDIPTLSSIALVVLAISLALVAVFFLRPGSGIGVVILVLFAGGGLAWAAIAAHDGNPGDWAGVSPLGTDPVGDAPAGADLAAFFARVEGANLELRIDARLAFDSGNQAPVVNAGADQTIALPASATLTGSATDDGMPAPPVTLTFSWTQVSGPSTVSFGASAAPSTTATFPTPGVFVLRLTASDSALSSSDTVQVTATGLVTVEDPANAVQKVVGPAGGVLQTTSGGKTYTLTIPVAALPSDTTITLTPVTSIPNLPLFSGPLVAAVDLQPSGLQFDRPATLAITLPSAVPPSGILGFLIDDAGTNLEMLELSVAGTTVTLAVPHFTTGVVTQATLDDFAQDIRPILDSLPIPISSTAAANLITRVGSWIDPDAFGFAVCSGTDLCARAFGISLESLTQNLQQACDNAQTFIQQGEPFLARTALSSVVTLAAELLDISETGVAAGFTGFEINLDLTCVGARLTSIVDLARTQAIANPRAGLLVLLVDIAGDGALLSLDDVTAHAQARLLEVLNAILSEANQDCLTDPATGELLIDLVRNTFPNSFLEGIDTGLATRFAEARAGCRIRISPALPTVGFAQQLQFTGTVVGVSPSGVTWSISGFGLGSTIDPLSGLFTAGGVEGTVTVVATSVANPTLFKRTPVLVVEGCVTPATSSSSAARRPMGASGCIAVTVTPASVTLAPGATQQFTATVVGLANQAVTWSAAGGTITPGGVYTAPSTPGSFTVTATSVEAPTATGTATVTVGAIVTVAPASVTLAPGATQQFTATVTGATSQAVTWTATGGTITPGGFYTAPSINGTHTVTARSVEVPTATGSATVVVGTPAPIRAGYDGTSTGQIVGCEPNCIPQGGTERWLLDQRTATEFFLIRAVPPPGPCLIVGSASCTPAFQITGGSFQATSTAGNTVTGSVGNGQLHFVYEFICGTTDGVGTCRQTFDGTYPIQVTPASLDFGTVTVGQSSTQIVTITNTGPLPVSGGFDSFPTGSPFTLLNTSNCLVSLAGGATCQISVRFAPIGVATFTHTLVIQTQVNLTGGDQVSLRGVGN